MPRHWIYLDEARTHEVHAQVHEEASDAYRLSTTEMPAGSRDPAEALVEERRLSSSDALRLALLQLEERLALSGTYYRADVKEMRWSLLAPPPAARRLDLTAHEVALPGAATGARMGFHHFHQPSAGSDSLLVTLPRGDLQRERAILAQLDFQFPRLEDADVKILHTRLTPTTLRSVLVREHIELPRRGFAKLITPGDYERAFGSRWLERTRETFRLATARMIGSLHRPAAPPEPREERALLPAERLEEALRSPRVEALRRRLLSPEEHRYLVESGELGIRRFIRTRQRRADHTAAYDLAMLESSLLVEYALRTKERTILEEESPKLVRFAAAKRP